MRPQIKQRLIGIFVILLMAAICLPLLFYQALPGIRSQSATSTLPSTTAMHEVIYELPMEYTVNVQSTENPKQIEKAPVAQKQVVSSKPSRPAWKGITADLPDAWALQLASFSKPSNAQHLLELLRESGLLAYSRVDKKTQVTQIFVGPYIDKAKAEKLQQQLKTTLHLNGVIRRYHS